MKYFTVGMAGHIDHGKTTLTKTLTNVNTDRLKEEMERKISIELGYAPLKLKDDMQVSIIDVPGHERFIRQMIAGVAGIDLVILVIAADEGIMPQTKEHVEILTFLGITHGIIALTKIDRVDEEFLELVSEDIQEQLQATAFEKSDIVLIDSIVGTGIEQLKQKIIDILDEVDMRDNKGPFRLPIDQVFTIQGQGTVVRGTVYSGELYSGDQLVLLPKDKKIKVRQIQSQNKEVDRITAGQRAALNITGISRSEITRGDVLVSSNHFYVTDTIDVSLTTIKDLTTGLKQRSPIKVHINTAEVMGKIVFFDRNELIEANDELVCQIRLDEPVVVTRGDRFIVRRPSPVETIGGGWVIDPNGKKYKFGKETISMLLNKKEGTPEDQVVQNLREKKIASLQEISTHLSLDEADLMEMLDQLSHVILWINKNEIVLQDDINELSSRITVILDNAHQKNTMRRGLNKAEVIQIFKISYPNRMIEYAINKMEEEKEIKKDGQFIRLYSFTPAIPVQWKKRVEAAIGNLQEDGLLVLDWEEYLAKEGVPDNLHEEIKHFLLEQEEIYELTDKLNVHRKSFIDSVQKLKENTNESFILKEAKDSLDISRKYLIPFLELLDRSKITTREGDKRKWV